MISLGDTFWAENPNSNNPPHLYFVITDPGRNQGRALLVNMTGRKAGSDISCILSPGIHPHVIKESIVQYAEAIFPEAGMIEQALNMAVFMPAIQADLKLVRQILLGALASPHLRMEYRSIVEAELKAIGVS